MFDVQLLVVIKKKSLYDIKPMIKYNNIIYNNFRREFVKTENNKDFVPCVLSTRCSCCL